MLKFERIWPNPLAMRMASAGEMQVIVSLVVGTVEFESLELVGWAVQWVMR
jgi:hypothetical protein